MVKNRELLIYSLPFVVATTSNATTIKEAVRATLIHNPQTSSLYQNMEGFKLYIDEKKGDYKPRIDLEVQSETEQENISGKINKDTTKTGGTVTLRLEQKLYDGGFTEASVGEAKYNYQANKYKNLAAIDDIVLQGITAYLDALKNEELLILAQNNIDLHIEYLKTAKADEEANGEDINRIQVESKLYIAYSKLYQQKVDKKTAVSRFKKLTTLDIKGYLCRPKIDEKYITLDMDRAIEVVMRKNYYIKEQIERLKAQRETINQEESRMMPTIDFSMQGSIDENIANTESTTTSYSAKIKLKYNLYNGGKDRVVQQREKIFLRESQHKLDQITDRIVDKLKQSYYNYNISKEKIEALKIVVQKNKDLLKRYKDQFASGTRTFMDILNMEADLFTQKSSLIDEEFKLIQSYYEILAASATLKDDVLKQKDSVCTAPVVDITPIQGESDEDNSEDDLDGLMDAEGEDDSGTNSSDEVAAGDKTDTTKPNGSVDVDDDLDIKSNVDAQLRAILDKIYHPEKYKKHELVDKELKNSQLLQSELKEVYVKGKEIDKKKFDLNILEDAKDIKVATINTPIPNKDIKDKNSTKEPKNKPKNIQKPIYNDKPKELKKGYSKPILADGTQEIENSNVEIVDNDELLSVGIPKLLMVDRSFYTISITTKYNQQQVDDFISKYKLQDKIFVYKFGKKQNMHKLLYGFYPTYSDAKKSLSKLNKELLNLFKPYVDNVFTHQKRYLKVNNIPLKYEPISLLLSDKKYTIDITKRDDEPSDIINFIRTYSLSDKVMQYKTQDQVQILYGLYDGYEETKTALEELDPTLHDNHKLKISLVSKHKKIYERYNGKFVVVNQTEHPANQIEVEVDKKDIISIVPTKEKPKPIIKKPIQVDENQTKQDNNITVTDEVKPVDLNKTDIDKIDSLQVVSKDIIDDNTTDTQDDNITVIDEVKPIDENTTSVDIITEPIDSNITDDSNSTTNSIEIISEDIVDDSNLTDTPKVSLQQINKKADLAEASEPTQSDVNMVDDDSLKAVKLLKANKSYYTINVISKDSLTDVAKFIAKYNLVDNYIVYKYGKDSRIKLIYGVYKTYSDAKKSLKSMDKNLRALYKPYIDNIYTHQVIYQKYNTNSNYDKSDIELLKVPKSYYTLNVATKGDDDKEIISFIRGYGLSDKVIDFRFGKQMNKTKILYGLYENYEDVSKALLQLDPSLLRSYRPYIDKVSKHQKLYKKYNLKQDKIDISSDIPKDEKISPIIKDKAIEKSKKIFSGVIDTNTTQTSKSKVAQLFENTGKYDDKLYILDIVKYGYTINITTKYNQKQVDDFLSKYGLKDDKQVITYKYAKGKKIKILYGGFKTHKEAKIYLKDNLSSEMTRLYGCYVDNIFTHQSVYAKDRGYEIDFNTPNGIIEKDDKNYTINIATRTDASIEKIIEFIRAYDINQKVMLYRFGDNMQHIKILFGTYKNYSDAKKDLEGLKQNLKTGYKPYIDKIDKHTTIYKKYN